MQIFWNIIKWITYPFIAVYIVILVLTYLNWLYLYIFKKMRPIKKINKYKKTHWIIKLFGQFPKQLALDTMQKDPNKFPHSGTWLFCGKQGCGKTIAMTYLANEIKKKYPLSYAKANIDIKDIELFYGWKQIVDDNNGEYGIMYLIDEITIWFNNKDSRNFPPEFLQDLNQQRKQRKVTMGTAQRFALLPKDIRMLGDTVYLPRTFFGCLTIVFVTSKEHWSEHKEKFKKYYLSKTWMFVHSPELRSMYDTYERVQRSARDGFEPNAFIAEGERWANAPAIKERFLKGS